MVKIKISKSVLSEMIQKSINKVLNENNDETQAFIPQGFYTVSNSGGYEVMLNNSGDMAKVRDAFGSDNPQISDWLPIEYIDNEDGETDEEGYPISSPVIDPNGYNIPLGQVMRINRFANESTTDKSKVNEDYNRPLFLETYIDGQQMLGSDGTSFLHSTLPVAVKNTVNRRINTIKALIPNIHPGIAKAKNITLKLTDHRGNVLKEFDVTKQVLNNVASFAESKSPKVIKVKLSELTETITHLIKEASANMTPNKINIEDNNFEGPFNDNNPQINEDTENEHPWNAVDEILYNIINVIDGEYKMQGMLGNKGVLLGTDFGNLRFKILNNSIYIIFDNEPEAEHFMSIINTALGDVISAGIPTEFDRNVVIVNLVDDLFEEAVASDGGYYSKPENYIYVSKKEADFIDSVIEQFKKDIQNPETPILVDSSEKGKINMKIIDDLKKNWNINFEYDNENGQDYFWLTPNQNLSQVLDNLQYIDIYDKIDYDDKIVDEEAKPSSGLSKTQKSNVVKKAKAGEDIGKPGKGFEKVVQAAKKSGAKDPEAIAAASMWKNIKR